MAGLKQFTVWWVQTVHVNLHPVVSLSSLAFSEIGVITNHAMLCSEISYQMTGKNAAIPEPRAIATN